MTPNTKNTQILKAKHFVKGHGFTSELFKSVTVPLDSELNEGDILIRTIYLGLDPYIRYAFTEEGGFAAPLDSVVSGSGVAEVIKSKNDRFPVNSIVLGVGFAWAEYSKISKDALRGFVVIPNARENNKVALTQYLSVLGLNGLTAFAVNETLVKFKKDQVVYISSAAGPVGSLIAFLAKREGVYVIGSAGSDEKVQYLLNDIGFDAAFNYKTHDIRTELSRLAPGGLDIYFDLVGGEAFDIGLEHLKIKGQIVALGNIAESSVKTPYVTKNLSFIIRKAATINGLTTYHHLDKFPRMWEEFQPLVERGEIPAQSQTVIKGLENAPLAFSEYLEGKYHGKVCVEVATL